MIKLEILHLAAAILATWRITELFTQDQVTQRFRAVFTSYLWQCPRCVSVWAGAWCSLMFALGPLTHDWTRWSLWPFALAYLYLARVERFHNKRIAKDGRRLVVEARGPSWAMNRNDFSPQETQEILSRMLSQIVQAQKSQLQSVPIVEQPTNGGVKAN